MLGISKLARTGTAILLVISAHLAFAEDNVSASAASDDKVLLWGDTHLHTSYSFDAFLNGNLSADPDTAYRFAKGLPVIHPYNRTRVQINTPLDFLVVADHAEFYGGIRDIYQDGIQDTDAGPIRRLAYWYNERQIRAAIDDEQGPAYFADLLPQNLDPVMAAKSWSSSISARIPGADSSAKGAWQRLLKMAEDHNEPGTFTTILGWEWSSIPGGANLHRVVMTDASPSQAANILPYGSNESPYPDDLWRWLEKTSAEIDATFLAIPHNPNISKGFMFSQETLRGETIDADYARLSQRFEPVVEVTQYKGDSETHPTLSPDDEFADFEHYPWHIQQERTDNYTPLPGDFARSGLKNGLALEKKLGVNPFQFGMIGATDSHTGLAAAEEPNFWGKMAFDSIPERKQGAALAIGPTGWSMQAGGLAGVWAEENTREAIVAAFARREVYATTGPRIRLRFSATQNGKTVQMGSVLPNATSSPKFIVHAERDPKSANLDRIQIVKGWVDAQGETHERVYELTWAGDRTLDANGKLASIGSTVNLQTGDWDNSIGAPVLHGEWEDSEFDAEQSAFYYARVLQIPTPRHSLLDALALGLKAPTQGASQIQERAYSSPIWLTNQ